MTVWVIESLSEDEWSQGVGLSLDDCLAHIAGQYTNVPTWGPLKLEKRMNGLRQATVSGRWPNGMVTGEIHFTEHVILPGDPLVGWDT